jgi:hypothetical protein
MAEVIINGERYVPLAVADQTREIESLRAQLASMTAERDAFRRTLWDAAAELDALPASQPTTPEPVRGACPAQGFVFCDHEDCDVTVSEAGELCPEHQQVAREKFAAQPPEQGASDGPWRVGRKQGRNIYRGEEDWDYLAVAFTPECAAGMVRLLNLGEAAERASPPAPAPAVEGPSRYSPFPWRVDVPTDGRWAVLDARACVVATVPVYQDADFIVQVANRWHAAQGKGDG